jgi:glycine/D-amino acid oxidase-like deaminating enzyme
MSRIAIIGGGVIGAAIAYELSLIPGNDLTLFEANTPASGATGASLGVLMGIISQKTKGRLWKLREISLKRYETLIPELENCTGQKIPYNRQGILKLIFEDENLENWHNLREIRRQQGWNLEIWPREQLIKEYPQINLENVSGAVYSPGDRQLDPTIFTQVLLAGATENGVNCHFGVKIQKFELRQLPDSKQKQCEKIYTPDGILEIDWLVIAGGLGSTPLTQELQETIDIRPVVGQALQIKLAEPIGKPEFQPVITGNDIHLVPLGNNEYWLGATVEFPDAEGKVAPNAQLLADFQQKAIALYPFLAKAEIIRSWWAKRPRPEGRPAPIIETLSGYNNVLVATGHYRNGVLLAPATAIAIREQILP